MPSFLFTLLTFSAAMLMVLPARAAGPVPIEPRCGKPFTYLAERQACVPDDTYRNLQGDDCAAHQGRIEKEACVLVSDDKAPKPNCGDARFAFKEGKCYVDTSVPRSAEGDYVGDCFTIRAVTPTLRDAGLAPGTNRAYRVVIVTNQSDINDGKDRELKVADAEFWAGPLWCLAKGNVDIKTVKASDLIEAGAARRGWVFGVMAVPFKYYRDAGTQTGNLSVGPYAGWRYARNGSGFTLAASAGLSALQGEVRDGSGAIIDRPQLMGYTTAVGVLWDLSKRPGARPFQMGFVIGKDQVAKSDVTKFQQHGKTWYALQFGYQFTDN